MEFSTLSRGRSETFRPGDMNKPRLLFIVGTRPEAIKCAPVIIRFRQDNQLDTRLLTTSQHRALQDEVLDFFSIPVEHDLNLMRETPDLTHLINDAWHGLSHDFQQRKPDMVLVQGDTSTAFIAALAAYYQKIPVAHIEAGLRTYDKYMPFPEEGNRRMISAIAELHFAPTQQARMNLIDEHIKEEQIFVVGNSGIDALLLAREKVKSDQLKHDLPGLDSTKKLILVTCHRRENWGSNLQDLCLALKQIVQFFPEVQILFLTHPNPVVSQAIQNELSGITSISVGTSVPYGTMVQLLDQCYMLLTDSGGLQEEAPVLGKPILVLREKTERPEGVEQGNAVLVGTNPDKILPQVERCLNDASFYEQFSRVSSPYGDGKTSFRIHQMIRCYFGLGEMEQTSSQKS